MPGRKHDRAIVVDCRGAGEREAKVGAIADDHGHQLVLGNRDQIDALLVGDAIRRRAADVAIDLDAGSAGGAGRHLDVEQAVGGKADGRRLGRDQRR